MQPAGNFLCIGTTAKFTNLAVVRIGKKRLNPNSLERF